MSIPSAAIVDVFLRTEDGADAPVNDSYDIQALNEECEAHLRKHFVPTEPREIPPLHSHGFDMRFELESVDGLGLSFMFNGYMNDVDAAIINAIGVPPINLSKKP